MKVNFYSPAANLKNVSFGKAYTTAQKQTYGTRVIPEAKKALGISDGISSMEIYTPAMPRDNEQDTGVGKINAKETAAFIDFARYYAGVNTVKDFSAGPMTKQQVNDYWGAYNRGALSLGDDRINLTSLTSEEYGEILSEDDIKPFIDNQKRNARKYLINFENELPDIDLDESPVAKGSIPDGFYNSVLWRGEEKREILTSYKNDETREKGPLYKAWENFKKLDETHPLRKEYEKFYDKKTPVDYDDMYTRLALAPLLRNGEVPYLSDGDDNVRGKNIWGDGYHFFEKFDANPYTLSAEDARVQRIKKEKYEIMKEEYKDEIDYYKFRQFIAHKQLKEAKADMNAKGVKLIGDMQWGFSCLEQQVYPDAFLSTREGPQGLPALDFTELQNPNSQAHKLLETKFKYNLENYDGVRLDMGWAYINYPHKSKGKGDNELQYEYLGDSMLNYIRRWAKEVKGKDFDFRNLIWEFDNNGNLLPFKERYQGYSQATPYEPIDELKNLPGLAMFTTEYEHNNEKMNGAGWMNTSFFKRVNFDPNKLILATNIQDGTPLRTLSVVDNDTFRQKREDNTGALMKDYYNYNYENYNSHEKYQAAKQGELFTTNNQALFYMDFLGKNEKLDSHQDKDHWGENRNGREDYKKRMGDWEYEYHDAVQEGRGYNQAVVLAYSMEAKDNNTNGEFLRDPENRRIYNELRAWGNYLADNIGGVKTEKYANEIYGSQTSDIPDRYRTDYASNDRLLK